MTRRPIGADGRGWVVDRPALAFEGVIRSARNRSGLALRGAHGVRLRDDRPLYEADDPGTFEALLASAS